MASFGLGSSTGTPLAPATAIDASTPWLAAADGNLGLLQSSLSILNVSVHAADSDQQYTLLQAAASYSQIPVLQFLLAKNVNLHAVDRDGDSALHYASTPQAAQCLVAAGIDVNIVNRAGYTALQAKQIEYKEMVDDPETEEDDVDVVQLKRTIDYLLSISQTQHV